jgi:hypothetical protein
MRVEVMTLLIRMKARMKEALEDKNRTSRGMRLAGGLALALVLIIALVLANGVGGESGTRRVNLTHALAVGGGGEGDLDARALVSRAVEKKFQIQMQENPAQPGEIPYQDVWVLNDPFFPLVGTVGNLTDNVGTLDSKLGVMLGRPSGTGTTTTTPSTTPSGSVPVTAEVSGQAVLVEDIYESRGIKYARVKVGDITYDRVKAGIVFANNFQVVEFKGFDTLVLMCGDESYELKKGQLRRI